MERLTKRENGHAHYPRCFEEPCSGMGCRTEDCEFSDQRGSREGVAGNGGKCMSDPGVIRGTIDGQEKYCRIPIRSRLYESVMEDDTTELSAEAILAMPHDKAAAVIDAIMSDWLYWLKRAGELWVLTRNSAEEAEAALKEANNGNKNDM